VTYWLLANRKSELHVDKAVAEFRKGVRQLEADISQVLSGSEHERFERTRKQGTEAGVPAELAGRIASLNAHNSALDIVELATSHSAGVVEAARIYFDLGTRIGLDWVQERVEQLPVEGPWQAVARTGLRDSALRIHRTLAEKILTAELAGSEQARVSAWLETAGEDLAHWQRMLTDMRAAGASDFATLSVGIEALRKLAD
jgi:glutamate dehydrogenase